jgi:hypothetical protein
MSYWEEACADMLAKIKRPDVPPQVLEASMRLQYGTLGHLDNRTIRKEAKLAAAMWDEDPEGCRKMAESYDLRISEQTS